MLPHACEKDLLVLKRLSEKPLVCALAKQKIQDKEEATTHS